MPSSTSSDAPFKVYAADHSAAVLRNHNRRTVLSSAPHLLPHLKPTQRILDVGCGPGSITIDLARRLPDGHVTGLEYVADPLAQARERAASEGLSNIDFVVGDIHSLDYADESFDVVHAHQVLQHVADPVLALREMRRVLKSGSGMVSDRESADWTWYPPSAGLTAWSDLLRKVTDSRGGHLHPGSWIQAWAAEAGFSREKIECSAGTELYSTPAERKFYSEMMAERVVGTAFSRNAIEGGFATQEELEGMAKAWKEWAENKDGWFAVWHGAVICHV
ncbi:MAG: hypothetical protein M1819_005847 [Sarea resinae]|nr:MAG: hypothetical protein M1819_005847 [Sarea resinae]